uniref:Tyrosyl-DNA phosphodiesterase 2-like n=1 Tax=Dermatophagoides pteronyssinus TaxID=6956 RepID=A0A6P6YMA1_DERPT
MNNDNNVDQQKLIDEFMLVTEGNLETARKYLIKHSWKVVEAINDYFEWMHDDYCRQEKEKQQQDGKNVDVEDNNDDDDYNDPVNKKAKIQHDKNDNQLRLFRHITYNIDSLNEKNLSIRIKAICKIILDEKATIVFLQEVHILKKIYQEHGYRGLFTGIVPRLIRVAPACAIMISSYEA